MIQALCVFLWSGIMTYNQKKAFWIIFIMFCIGFTVCIYPQGAFDNITLGGSAILTVLYLIIAFFIHLYVKSNPKTFNE
jgi:hypothetical protein